MNNLIVRTPMLRGFFAGFAVIVLLTALFTMAPFYTAMAQVAPPLGAAQRFAVLGSSTVTNTATPTTVVGDLGVSPGTSVTGFPPGIVTKGTIHAGDAVAAQARSDTTTAYNNLAGQTCTVNLTGQDLGGMTLAPGVYCFNTSAALTGALTLDAQDNPDAVWVFQTGSTLTTAGNSSMVVINGGQQYNVFWQVGSSVTLNLNSMFIGNILAAVSVSLNTGASVSGRVLAGSGAVTMIDNDITITWPAVNPFTDVPPTYWAYDYIMAIYYAGYTTGSGVGTFEPELPVTREQMAAFIIRAADGEPPTDYCSAGPPFPDCSADSWSCKYIKRLSELGLTTGYGNTGLYMPAYNVTRAQTAAFLVRAVEGEPATDYCSSGSPFNDVAASDWSCKYIKRLYELRITTGYGDSRYEPDDLVTRAQMAVFLGRAFLGMD